MDIRLIAGISALSVVIVMWLYYILRDKNFFSKLEKSSQADTQSTARSSSANTQQQQFAAMSNTNHSRLHTYGNKSKPNNLNERAKAERNAQTVIAMAEQKKTKSKADKVPHFCKDPNDSDMIKRY
ncbi:unnamed protein product [Chironomus riparius]|uniref:Uncharacterized protein n=1 Tax=Chironomus riparius TaxID=315576 RepID=A0A9N9S3E3_9DIPT|nr:unnamed protein product [Chironomus riparius]